MGLFDEMEAENKTPERILLFVHKIATICEIIGDANMESDDHGDRWLEWRHPEDNDLWVQARASYEGNVPVWKITAGSYRYSKLRFAESVLRKNF